MLLSSPMYASARILTSSIWDLLLYAQSFTGLPHEAQGLHLEGRHWKAGAFSAADAAGTYDEATLLASIWRRIGHPNVSLVSGFFSESLPHMPRVPLRPALLVDIDVRLSLLILARTRMFQLAFPVRS